MQTHSPAADQLMKRPQQQQPLASTLWKSLAMKLGVPAVGQPVLPGVGGYSRQQGIAEAPHLKWQSLLARVLTGAGVTGVRMQSRMQGADACGLAQFSCLEAQFSSLTPGGPLSGARGMATLQRCAQCYSSIAAAGCKAPQKDAMERHTLHGQGRRALGVMLNSCSPAAGFPILWGSSWCHQLMPPQCS